MKPQTRAARAMADDALNTERARLRREVAAAQSRLDALDREARRRLRASLDRRARPKSREVA